MGPLLVVGFLSTILWAVLFLDVRPEFVQAQSDDGLFAVEGDVPSTVAVHVAKDVDASNKVWTSVVSDVYVAEPDGVLLPVPVTIHMKAADYSGSKTYSIAYFDGDRNTWVPVDTTRNTETGLFEAHTNHFSHWALLERPVINTFDTDREALLADVHAMIPVGTTGYSVDLAYATVDADFVLLDQEADRWICAQPVSVRDKRVQTVSDKSVSLRIDGVERSATLRAITHWDVGSGCSTLIHPQTP